MTSALEASARASPFERSMSNMTGVIVALDVIAVVFLVSFATGDRFVPTTAMVVAPLAASAFSRPAVTLLTTVFALIAGVVVGVMGGLWGTGDLVGRCIVIIVGGCVGAVLAAIRERREASLVETGRHLRVEHGVVSVLQESLLPTMESRSLLGIRLATAYVPVNGRVDVGGDWFDAFPLDDDRLGISIGDVAGHGLDSVVLMVQLRIGMRLAALRGAEPGEVLDESGRLLQSISPDAFATAIFATYDSRTRALTWSRAGHCLPLLATARSARLLDEVGGLPLGIASGKPYPTATVELDPDEVVLLHTDGLYERHDRSIAVGEDVLLDLVPAILREQPDLQQFVDWLPGLVHETEPEDDLCVLALRLADS